MAKESGAFPKWPLAGGDSGSMIGAPAELIIADAHQKGIGPFDAESAYQILRTAALTEPSPPQGRGGRNHVEDYMRLGYVPSSTGGSVSWTTEYARGDFALAGLAAALGHAEDARLFSDRSGSFRKLYDPKTGFLRGRASDGSFKWMSFDSKKYTDDFVEANAWQSMWMNEHDVPGYIAMLGGREALIAKLSEMFEQTRAEWESQDQTSPPAGADRPGYYWHGNEPDISAAYLFALAGRPDLTQRWARWLLATQYSDTPAGLPGNDDGGTMSAWYVFSAIGIYPIVGSDRYVLTAPLFPRVEVAVSGGVFTIEAPEVSAEKPYVKSVTLDGVPLDSFELRHSALRPGSTLRFVMSKEPSTAP
jgi:predicted alpha-1,2-mannosidase